MDNWLQTLLIAAQSMSLLEVAAVVFAMGYLLLAAALLNSMLNNAFRLPRPYWIVPDLGLTEARTFISNLSI